LSLVEASPIEWNVPVSILNSLPDSLLLDLPELLGLQQLRMLIKQTVSLSNRAAQTENK